MDKTPGVSEETAQKLLQLQKRCVHCGSTSFLEIHHRIFRSEGKTTLNRVLKGMQKVYLHSYNKPLSVWESIHDIQNLCVLCMDCHQGLHYGANDLRKKLRESFTCPITGFSVSFYKENKLY